jgi:hypothetical protein
MPTPRLLAIVFLCSALAAPVRAIDKNGVAPQAISLPPARDRSRASASRSSRSSITEAAARE